MAVKTGRYLIAYICCSHNNTSSDLFGKPVRSLFPRSTWTILPLIRLLMDRPDDPPNNHEQDYPDHAEHQANEEHRPIRSALAGFTRFPKVTAADLQHVHADEKQQEYCEIFRQVHPILGLLYYALPLLQGSTSLTNPDVRVCSAPICSVGGKARCHIQVERSLTCLRSRETGNVRTCPRMSSHGHRNINLSRHVEQNGECRWP